MTDKKTPSIEEQEKFYDKRWGKLAGSYASGVKLDLAVAIISEISELRMKSPRILDMGCGTGGFSAMLGNIGQVTGVELSSQAVCHAKILYPKIDFIAGDIFNLPFPEEEFDLIVLQEVIEHVNEQSELIAKCLRLLKPNGYLILTTPNRRIVDALGTLQSGQKKGLLQPLENLLTVGEIKRLIVGYFAIVRCYTFRPTGHRGWLRIVNSPRLRKFAIWRALRSALPVGLHIMVVAQRRP